MKILYYDNLEPTPTEEGLGLIEVERVYLLDWSRFEASHWDDLSLLYENLPGSVRHREIPYWFGDDEAVAPFLGASIEPPGLQVYGVLPDPDWSHWDRQFCEGIAELPIRVLE